MSIFGSMTTAVLGLTAQSSALGHISDNIANAQTSGYKRVNSSFETLVLQSNERLHSPGGVVARPVFLNNIQGAVSQVQSQTSAAIQGQGFFSVSKLSRGLTGPGQQGEVVQTQTGTLNADNVYYTRVGDFDLDKNRYLVNSAGFALNGWMVDDVTGELKKDQVTPIQVSTLTDRPQATQGITYGANLPATPTEGVPISPSSINIYDTQGNARSIQFNWRQDGANNWRLGIDAPGSSSQPVAGSFAGGTVEMTEGPVVAGVTPVAQVSSVLVNGSINIPASTVTVGGRSNYYPDKTSQDNIRVGDSYSLTVNGAVVATIPALTTVTVANYTSFSDVAADLASQINTTANTPYIAEIDSVDPRKIRIKTLDGSPVEVSGAFSTTGSPQLNTVSGPATNIAAGVQTSAFTFSSANVDVGDEFRVTVGNKEFSVRVTTGIDDVGPPVGPRISAAAVAAGGGIDAIVARLAEQINDAGLASLDVAPGGATAVGGVLTLTGAAAATFTTTAAITNADTRRNQIDASTPADYTAIASTTVGSLNAVSAPVTNTVAGVQTSDFTFTPATADVGDVFQVSVDGTDFFVRVTDSTDDVGPPVGPRISAAAVAAGGGINAIVARMAAQINNASLATLAPAPGAATAVGGVLTLTGNAGVPFTPTASVANTSRMDFDKTTALAVPDQYSVIVNGIEFKTTVSHANINRLTTEGAAALSGTGSPIDGVLLDLKKQIDDAGFSGVTVELETSGTLRIGGADTTPVASTLKFNTDESMPQVTDNVRVGDVYTVSVDSVKYSVSVTEDNIVTMGSYGGVAAELAAKINSARPSAPVIATVVNSELRLTARNPGTSFDVDQENTSGTSSKNTAIAGTPSEPTDTRGQRREFTFPQTAIDIGDRYSVSVDGVPITVDVTKENYSNFEDITGVIQELANKINAANLNVVASTAGGRLTLTHNTATTGRFEATASIDNATGGPGTMTLSTLTSNVMGVRQQQTVTLTGSPGDVGAAYTVTVDGTPITYTTTGDETSMEDIAENLANLINKTTSLAVTASAQGSVLTLVSKTQSAASPFDLDTFALSGETPAHIQLTFGTDPESVGTITSISTAKVGTGTAITSVNQSEGADATITFTVDYGFGPQQVTLNVGKFQRSGGVTQYAGSEINVTQLVQDGASRGQFKEVVYGDNGDVIVNYDNGRSRTIGRIPVVTFNNPNALQREAGGVFIETDDGGRPNFNDPGNNGAGSVIANSVEASNVDIADEFTKLIVTQRTYSANTKIVTTSDEMLQEVLGLKR